MSIKLSVFNNLEGMEKAAAIPIHICLWIHAPLWLYISEHTMWVLVNIPSKQGVSQIAKMTFSITAFQEGNPPFNYFARSVFQEMTLIYLVSLVELLTLQCPPVVSNQKTKPCITALLVKYSTVLIPLKMSINCPKLYANQSKEWQMKQHTQNKQLPL